MKHDVVPDMNFTAGRYTIKLHKTKTLFWVATVSTGDGYTKKFEKQWLVIDAIHAVAAYVKVQYIAWKGINSEDSRTLKQITHNQNKAT